MSDLFRDSSVGQLINHYSNGRLLPYEDQKSTYLVPSRYLLHDTSLDSSAVTLCGDTPSSPKFTPLNVDSLSHSRSDSITPQNELAATEAADVINDKLEMELEKGDLKLEAIRNAEKEEVAPAPYPYLVDWEGESDPDNPRNWSSNKRLFVGSLIGLLTFSVYVGSAIYTSSIPDIIVTFGVSATAATWGLTLFVLGYGIGPMFLSPLQEMRAIGRTPVYIIGLFIFVMCNLITVVCDANISTILALRFFAGFFGSPALATGGASFGDIFAPRQQPYAIGAWSIFAVLGPTSGPIISSFAVSANGWKWSFFPLLFISSFALIMLTFLLPETLGTTVLLRRAQRLRKLTGNELLKTQDELDVTEGMAEQAYFNFLRAMQLSIEPAVLFANVYIALVYAIFYTFFESFPLVFTEIYHFSLGSSSLPFAGFIVTGALTFIGYALYNKFHMEPRMDADPDLPPEARLELAVFASFLVPISTFIFGWGARESVHWIVPVIGASLYLPGIFLIFQSILIYITMSYPKYEASLLAGNDFFRSSFASFFPLFGAALFTKLGLGGGSSLLAGLSILLIPVLYALMKYGGRLRAHSKWTDHHL